MQTAIVRYVGALAIGSMLLLPAQAVAHGNKSVDENSAHDHSHDQDRVQDHPHDSDDAIYKGYFDESQIEARMLSDWEGDWQSVYLYLQNGTLDPVMAHKAEQGDKSVEEYRAEYETGYTTDVDRIVISGNSVAFYRDGDIVEGRYATDGYEILTYKKGNRGVRFIFRKTGGDDEAPQFIQFSDHRIAPAQADHYHLYWGDDREALLEELTNWPTYYPSSLGGNEIVGAMMAH
ncbi:ZinT family metal-binding protein [Nitratireductor luteus]|uniref:ZinT family metal-binding protein n=1 Tax=Nitratireductor luteus TaxID=2976980 RepID=UPI00223EAF61|nr:metal-binding protein ZinT [Nitratireductor luteus]